MKEFWTTTYCAYSGRVESPCGETIAFSRQSKNGVVVRAGRLELPSLSALEPKSSASANFATPARKNTLVEDSSYHLHIVSIWAYFKCPQHLRKEFKVG